MRNKLLLSIVLTLIFATAAAAQGGKAEPLRISFAKGKTSATRTGSLKIGEVYELVFGARAGQSVKIKIVSTAPKGKFHYFSLHGDGFDFATESDVDDEYNFTTPEAGDYFLNINFNPKAQAKAGRFSLTLTITN